MSGLNFALTSGAQDDALAIWERIADDVSEARADKVIAQIYDECQRLADFPGMGHFREDLLDRRYKFWHVWSYVIAYRWKAKPIEVIAIVHGARDLRAYLVRRSGI